MGGGGGRREGVAGGFGRDAVATMPAAAKYRGEGADHMGVTEDVPVNVA